MARTGLSKESVKLEMGTQIVAQEFVEVNHVELCPDVTIRTMQWYWGVCPLTGQCRYFWVGPEVSVTDMPNYISDEAPWVRVDSRQGVSYHRDRSL